MRLLQLFQPVHHPVIGRIRDFRLVQHVILIFVVAQLLAEVLDLFFHSGGCSFGHETLELSSSRHSEPARRGGRSKESLFSTSTQDGMSESA
jgi:hypothetical protein